MSYQRRVYLSDTDAAGVIYFARLLAICHEAYEDWLNQEGMNFRELVNNPDLAIPIVHGEIDFLRPIFCAEQLVIQLTPQQTGKESFIVNYEVWRGEELVAKAMTKHIAIEPMTRRRTPLPSKIIECLKSKAQ